MLTYEELQYFAAFSEYGTLTEVAEQFTISQPTITRAMKKAEEVFGIPLFHRTKNSISLNDSGRLAAEEIKLLLKQTEGMIARVRAHDRASRTIAIGTAAVVELPGLIGRLSRAFPEKMLSSETGLPTDLEKGLEADVYQLIILPYDPTARARDNEGGSSRAASCYAEPIGEEHLLFFLPADHPLAGREALTLADLNGENLLLFSDIGFWAEIVREKMPDSRFLVQNERYSFRELVENSVLSCFVTDITVKDMPSSEQRVAIPITDPEVNVTYYLACKASLRSKLKAAFA
ncbi:MAG: LysR family transcriptional regulator [Anaerovoracaceae bacterium]|jgi:DNA-binding transcriptional LysR family regulator